MLNEGILSVVINRSDYATYKYFRDLSIDKPGTYAMGVDTFIYDPDQDAFIFTLRSSAVAFDTGKISATSGGVLSFNDGDPCPSLSDFAQTIKEQAETETQEELTTTGLGDHKLVGACVDENTLKIEFLFLATATHCQIKDQAENIKTFPVKRGQLQQFLSENEGKFETSTLWHLEYWADKLDKLSPKDLLR